MNRHYLPCSLIGIALCSVVSLLGGCAISKRTTSIGSQFYGIWENIDPRYFNWWEISATRVVNYGIALREGKCRSDDAEIIAADVLNVPFGNAGTVHLGIIDNKLIFVSPKGVAQHKRVQPEAICRRPDGTYFDGAPHPSSTGEVVGEPERSR